MKKLTATEWQQARDALRQELRSVSSIGVAASYAVAEHLLTTGRITPTITVLPEQPAKPLEV